MFTRKIHVPLRRKGSVHSNIPLKCGNVAPLNGAISKKITKVAVNKRIKYNLYLVKSKCCR